MKTLVMDWDTFQSNNQIKTDIQIMIRPPMVPFHEVPLPELIKQEPQEYFDCCCDYNYGRIFGEYRHYVEVPSISPVPEIEIFDMFAVGVLTIGFYIILKNIRKK